MSFDEQLALEQRRVAFLRNAMECIFDSIECLVEDPDPKGAHNGDCFSCGEFTEYEGHKEDCPFVKCYRAMNWVGFDCGNEEQG